MWFPGGCDIADERFYTDVGIERDGFEQPVSRSCESSLGACPRQSAIERTGATFGMFSSLDSLRWGCLFSLFIHSGLASASQ